jgi:hypothetical protein
MAVLFVTREAFPAMVPDWASILIAAPVAAKVANTNTAPATTKTMIKGVDLTRFGFRSSRTRILYATF